MRALKGILAALFLLGLTAAMVFIIVLIGYLAITGAVAVGSALL